METPATQQLRLAAATGIRGATRMARMFDGQRSAEPAYKRGVRQTYVIFAGYDDFSPRVLLAGAGRQNEVTSWRQRRPSHGGAARYHSEEDSPRDDANRPREPSAK